MREEGERSWVYFRHKPDKLNQHAREGVSPYASLRGRELDITAVPFCEKNRVLLFPPEIGVENDSVTIPTSGDGYLKPGSALV